MFTMFADLGLLVLAGAVIVIAVREVITFRRRIKCGKI